MPHEKPAPSGDTSRSVVVVGGNYSSTFALDEHRHRRGQLVYATSGVITVTTPHGAWVAPPERGVWIPPDVPHAVRTVGAVQFRCVFIEPADVFDMRSNCEVLQISPLLRQLLIETMDIPRDYEEHARDALVMSLLIAELNQAQSAPVAVPFPRHPELAARCHEFLKNPQVSESIDQWANSLSMDRRRFTRLFRRDTGMSFVEWRQQACLSSAIPRLIAKEPVTSIALDLGYESIAGFSTMFKKAIGVSPSAFRLK